MASRTPPSVCVHFRGILLLIVAFVLPGLISGQNCPDDSSTPVVVCYYASWGIYRPPGNGTYKIEFIDSKLCTHLIYGFAGLNLNGMIDALDYSNDITRGSYKDFNELKERNPCLKTLLAIGGWNEGSERYSLMAETAKGRQDFADGVLRFLCHFGFDGLDVDWEYPTLRGGIVDDKGNFIELLRTLKATFARRKKLLTVAIATTPSVINSAYNVEEMCQLCDLVMVMAYDLQDPTLISVHAPLKRRDGEPDSRVVIDDGIVLLKELSCDPKKLVLGIGAFGRSFTMKSATDYSIGDQVAGLGKAGPYLLVAGSLGYNEICEGMLDGKWTVKQLAKSAMSYAYKDKQWVSYDDEESIAIKAAYAVEQNLGGLMLYSMDTDDFHGNCLGKTYPLLRAMNKGLGRIIS